MASTRVRPYVGATIEAQARFRMYSGPHTGEPVTLTLYRGMKSCGYKTNFEHVPCLWLTIQRPSEPLRTISYTGDKRVAAGRAIWAKTMTDCADMRIEEVTP